MKKKQHWLILLVCGCMLVTLFGCGGTPGNASEGSFSESSGASSDLNGEIGTLGSDNISDSDSNTGNVEASDPSATTNNTKPTTKPTSGSNANASSSPSNSNQALQVKDLGGRTITFCAPS